MLGLGRHSLLYPENEGHDVVVKSCLSPRDLSFWLTILALLYKLGNDSHYIGLYNSYTERISGPLSDGLPDPAGSTAALILQN